ncbi:MAG: hypothetical protein J6Y91_03970 [Alphaproteobacteria bacterium]|nr:hypothetical protein [Alphaproteobacteria bacterium]
MENDNPSIETQQAIKDGINWIANWYKDRCDAGVISSEEYADAVKKLQQVKIYTTKQGTNRVTEELEKGNLHFKPELLKKGASVEMWKKLMAQKNTFPLGWCAKDNIEEPVIILDIDKIKEKMGNDPKAITSEVIHELTHLTADSFHAEQDVKKIIYGENIDGAAKRAYNSAHHQSVGNITINPNIIADTNTALVVPVIDNAKTLLHSNTGENYDFMNDGVSYNKYLDGNNEIYARMMQLRYENGLKAGELIRPDDLHKMLHDEDIINRYKAPVIISILNDVAMVPGVKEQMKKDAELARISMADVEKTFYPQQNGKMSETKMNTVSVSDLIRAKNSGNFYS